MFIHRATDIRESIENLSTEDRRSIGFPSADDEFEIKWGGVLLAATAFALTRILVVEAVYAPTGPPPGASLARLLPLVLGLGPVAMGLVLQGFSGEMAVIGGLYSIPTFAVGWITHLFHSVVFAILSVAFVSWRGAPGPNSSLKDFLAVGLAYSLVLWLVAGGVVMGVWLNAVGIPSPIPDLGLPGLVGHLVWGLGLAVSFYAPRTGIPSFERSRKSARITDIIYIFYFYSSYIFMYIGEKVTIPKEER